MNEFSEALSLNPQAAKDLEPFKDIMETLSRLREAGVTKGDEFVPMAGIQTLGELKSRSRSMQASRLVLKP